VPPGPHTPLGPAERRSPPGRVGVG
jgi:hypothetical protein